MFEENKICSDTTMMEYLKILHRLYDLQITMTVLNKKKKHQIAYRKYKLYTRIDV